jgi:hypothetical protein
MPNIMAEYQQWSMHGCLKRATIGRDTRYVMEFSLEQLQKQCTHTRENPSWTRMDDNHARLQEVSEVNCDQEWEIQDIIGKEVVDGVVHYWVQWEATLLPEHESPKTKALVKKFEARRRAQARQKDVDAEGQGNVPVWKAGRQAIMGASITRQQKRPRGRPRKHI